MAALLDLETQRCQGIDSAFDLIAGHVRSLDPSAAIAQIQRYQGRLSALHLEATAKLDLATGSDRASKRAMNDGKTSKRSIAKAAKRGKAASKNADLIDKASQRRAVRRTTRCHRRCFSQDRRQGGGRQ